MTKTNTTNNKDPRLVLDVAATSIRNLVLDLEKQEKEGKQVSATEIQKIANQLKVHVEALLAASKSLGNSGKSES